MATAGRGPETSHPTGSAHGHPVGGWAPSPEPTRRGPRLPAVLCLPVAAAAFGTSVVLEAEFSGRHAPETIFGVLSTRLHDPDRPIRWWLVVTGKTPWGRLTERFLVPVYADPTASRADAA